MLFVIAILVAAVATVVILQKSKVNGTTTENEIDVDEPTIEQPTVEEVKPVVEVKVKPVAEPKAKAPKTQAAPKPKQTAKKKK